ncbi:MAG TPA: M1 family peptidase, partial [Calditrichae bacterium]|nr:M1 family peptidase [Calditrichia bacterium]
MKYPLRNWIPIMILFLTFSAFATGGRMVQDPHSHARPDEAVVKHIDLDLTVDFDHHILKGWAKLTIDNKTGAHRLILDSRRLTIERVVLDDGKPTTFKLVPDTEFMGDALEIAIEPNTKTVTVYYQTAPDAPALQWLAPEQTADKKAPFLFTQSQPILARSWIPCQDSPGIRITYTATIRTRPDLLALMSATNSQQKSPDGVYHFTMPQPIPPYLFALAVGNLEFRPISNRSGVYAEPSVVDKAAWEFADTEKMIQAAENLYGPYRWERYDILVLPPSFPFGGMENPRLTFATPTVLAGDRSLTALVAHELAHSWSGNLVTNATWDDFWLNEGFTVYFERRIMEALYGKKYADMLAVLGYQDLLSTLEELGYDNPLTQLKTHLEGHDPDEGITDIPYEKGYFFLRMLEEAVGRPTWDAFLRKYFDTFAFQSMTTERFEAYMTEHLLHHDAQKMKALKIKEWLYQPGLPENCPKVHSTEFDRVEQQVQRFLNGTPPEQLDVSGWTTHHWLHFLRSLPETLTNDQLAALDKAFHFTQSGNSEILSTWLGIAIDHQYKAAYPQVKAFLTSQGRRKFL